MTSVLISYDKNGVRKVERRWANRGRTVRRARAKDLDLIETAQNASPVIANPMTRSELAEYLKRPNVGALILEVSGVPRACLVYTIEGTTALLSCLWRSGPPLQAPFDFSVLWNELRCELKAKKVTTVCGMVSAAHSQRRKLLKFYARYGLRPDLMRVTGTI